MKITSFRNGLPAQPLVPASLSLANERCRPVSPLDPVASLPEPSLLVVSREPTPGFHVLDRDLAIDAEVGHAHVN